MNNQLSWGERQLRMMRVLGTAEGRGAPAKEMLKKTDTNKIIVSERQAALSIALKMEYAGVLSKSKEEKKTEIWSWIDYLPDAVHDYQLVIGGQSRKDYKEVVGLMAKAMQPNKNTLSIETSGGNESA